MRSFYYPPRNRTNLFIEKLDPREGLSFATKGRPAPLAAHAADRPETIGVTLPPSLTATMSAMVMRSSTSEIASGTLTIVKRTAQAFTLLQSPHAS
jgi:hypothetical protein